MQHFALLCGKALEGRMKSLASQPHPESYFLPSFTDLCFSLVLIGQIVQVGTRVQNFSAHVYPHGCSSGNEFSISSETCWAIRRNHETAELWITQHTPWGRHNGIVFILQRKPNKVIETLIFPGKPNHAVMNYKGAGGSQVSPINTVDRKGRGSRCHEQYFKADFNLNWALWDPGC